MIGYKGILILILISILIWNIIVIRVIMSAIDKFVEGTKDDICRIVLSLNIIA